MNDDILKVAALGKYIYRCWLESRRFEHEISKDISGVEYYIYSSQWLASLYVIIEGWRELRLNDTRIEIVLSKYEEYEAILRRCRNAVYHYQKDIVDKRVEDAVSKIEFINWSRALLEEYIRFLYTYPVMLVGVSIEALDLQKDYFGLIGWEPTSDQSVRLCVELENIYKMIIRNKGAVGVIRDALITNWAKFDNYEFNSWIPMLSLIDDDCRAQMNISAKEMFEQYVLQITTT